MFITKKRKTRIKKAMALFMLFTLVNQIFAPSVAFALTAGPTAPEATNFEPIDTTDTVNPLTGDFTYNLPLLEVPGPEGGYPLALAYHAGIQPNEEASWVGLGWSLNPGAITRNVNGYADDWHDATGVERTYWNGGHTQTLTVDVGIANSPASVNFGLSFSQDTYRGFGVGYSASVGFKAGAFSIGPSFGVSAYGGDYFGVSVSRINGTLDGIKSSESIGIQTNFRSTKLNASLHTPALGISMDTKSTHPSLTIGTGASVSVNNAKANKISTSSTGFSFSIGIFGVGYQDTRYWTDESTGFMANGVLYNRQTINYTTDLNLGGDDNYQLLDAEHTNIIDNPDPLAVVGGTYPNFDNYNVTAQGLGGNIRPYIFSAVLYNQNRVNAVDHHNDVYAQLLPSSGKVNTKWQFRFINDFSNSYIQNTPWNQAQNYIFDDNPKYGNNDSDYGYDTSTNRLEGSNHIEYFTNDQINNNYAKGRGFINCDTVGFTRGTSNAMKAQIGGFMITNSSGVTYHYALPAYSSNELVHTELINRTGGYHYNDLRKNNSYAYTWYLTAITGPDYVSRTTSGVLDKSDWGYWVKFDYGKWTDSYNWRNPSEGFHKDLDNQFQNYSSGTKELYYLDAIETRSHTALFVKDIRNDAKSIGSGGFDNTSVSSLNLSYVLLMQNDQLNSTINAIRSAGTVTSTGATPNKVIDISDISQLSEQVTAKCLRKTLFSYDYSQCPGVPNSFTAGSGGNTNNWGKLTLLSVDFQGKGGAAMQPPIQFQYELDPSNPVNQNVISVTQSPTNQAGTNQTGTISVQTPVNLSAGDIISFVINSQRYYCTLLSTTDNINYNVLFLNNSPGGVFSNITATRTKNPPYNKDTFDNWNFYKSDYVSSPTRNENLSRFTTAVSNKSIDAWSIRSINSSIGAKININYEGDTYNKSVLNKNRSLILASFNKNSPGNYSLSVNNENADLTKIYHTGDKVSLVLSKRVYTTVPGINILNPFTAISSDSYPTPVVVQSVDSQNSMTVTVDSGMDTEINKTSGYSYWQGGGANGTTPQGGNYFAQIVEGNISANGGGYFCGGGIRVKDIIVDDLDNNVKKTSYNYAMPATADGQLSTSGVTPYEPLVFDQVAAFANYTVATSPLGYQFTDASYFPWTVHKRAVYKDMNTMLAIANELPAPGVMYEYITVSESNIRPDGSSVPIEGKTLFQYEVFRENMVGVTDYHYEPPTAINANKNIGGGSTYFIAYQSRRGMVIKDYTSRIGNLKRVVTYDNFNNKLTEKINHYLHDDLDNTTFESQISNYEPRLSAYNNIGVIEEAYGNSRVAVDPGHISTSDPSKDQYDDLLVMSNKQTFPSIQTGTTQIDYKNGTHMDQQNLAFDFYTGAVIKTLTSDSYGNRFINQVTPAYAAFRFQGLIYPALGLKTHDDNLGAVQHKQMLSQQASNYIFSADASNNPIGVVSASVQTWSNNIPVLDPDNNVTTDINEANVWRAEKELSWNNSGTAANNLTPIASFVDYFAPGGSSDPSWKKTSQITQYNVYSSALEANDINNNYTATRMGYNNSKVITTAGLARYNEIAYTGAEDNLLTNGNFSTNISKGGGTIVADTSNAHTGNNSLLVPASASGFTYTIPLTGLNSTPQNYSVSVWVKPTAANFNLAQLNYKVGAGTTVTPTQSYSKVAAGWYLLEMTVPASAITGTGNLVISCKNASAANLYFDDFRFQPTSASALAYVYDKQTGELTYILSNNNLYVRFQYDAIGRLVRTYKEVLGKSIVPISSAVSYNYGRNN